MKTQSEKLNAYFDYEARYLGERKEGKWTHDAWTLIINGVQIDYKTGTGLREVSKYSRDHWAYKEPKPKAPKVDDVIYSLLSDYRLAQDTFEDFCANTGYDTDSRKALETYLACQESGQKLLKIGVNFSQAQTAFENY